MKTLLIHKQVPSARLVQRLGEIVKRLDNSLQPSATKAEKVSKDGTLDVCPELYQGGRLGYPFYAHEGWYTIHCTNVKPIRSVISVLVNTVAYPREDENHIKTVLKGITETYPTVQVHLATRSNEVMEDAKKYKNIDVVKVDDAKLGKGWNTLISKVSTPYVLIARDVFHFTWLTQLERQIRVVSQIPNVGVVGGAYRNYSGHWKVGCAQTTIKNYVLEYQEGYYHSKNECMFCDYLQGPFVTKTNMLKLDESLPNEVIFQDWFLRVVEDGNLVMSCPDAMYFTTDYSSYSKRTDKKVWTSLAKKWELNRVLLPQGVKHSFSCQDIGFKCSGAHSDLLPVCCLEEYADALTFFRNFTDTHNISFELDSGSVLGGVKFNGLVPWDVDGDLILKNAGFEIFGKRETKEHFQKNGYILTEYKPGFVRVNFNGFDIEVWGLNVLSNTQYLPPELQKPETFTKANIRGNWIDTQYSPGLYSRNRYGREILKHSQSWRKVGLPHSFADYVPGSFKPCEKPNHHACLHNFPGDGDIPFLVT
ncbi:hypothetical protein OS493_017748 [Desmophyllum pertusum]|uniref:Uncharacterized protein n=1 Tax=Desmophyllum pertusum TaxID=174260 RepID=A0A9W9ZFM4_9CNID|nr:hypothetical protein OS493_017748 [Desmophyllum pertusum]